MTKQRMVTAVLGIPITFQRKVLLSQRLAPGNPATHMKWQLIGGGMEFGETPEQTISREFQEETQLSVEILFPNPIVKTSIWAGNGEDGISSHITLLAYLLRAQKKTPDWSNDDETNDIQWFTLDEALKLDSLPQTNEFLVEAFDLAEKLNLFSK